MKWIIVNKEKAKSKGEEDPLEGKVNYGDTPSKSSKPRDRRDFTFGKYNEEESKNFSDL